MVNGKWLRVGLFSIIVAVCAGAASSAQGRPGEPVQGSAPLKDISGSWGATMTGPMGSMEITYKLKVTNGKITGTTVTRFGEAPIIDGAIDGENLRFTVEFRFFGNSQRSEAEGRIAGDTLIITPAMPGPPPGMIAFKAEPLTFRRK